MITGSIYQKDTAILNVYVPNNRATNHVEQKLIELKGELDKSTTVRNTSFPLSQQLIKQLDKISKDTEELCEVTTTTDK